MWNLVLSKALIQIGPMVVASLVTSFKLIVQGIDQLVLLMMIKSRIDANQKPRAVMNSMIWIIGESKVTMRTMMVVPNLSEPAHATCHQKTISWPGRGAEQNH